LGELPQPIPGEEGHHAHITPLCRVYQQLRRASKCQSNLETAAKLPVLQGQNNPLGQLLADRL